jgi:hypothetical protein
MKFQAALFATLVATTLFAGQALACDPALRFKDKNTCQQNRQAVLNIINDPKFQAGFLTPNARNGYNDPEVSQCTTATFCLSHCAYFTMDLFDGGPGYKVGRACEELKRRVTEQKLLDEIAEPKKDASLVPLKGPVNPWNTDGRAGSNEAL